VNIINISIFSPPYLFLIYLCYLLFKLLKARIRILKSVSKYLFLFMYGFTAFIPLGMIYIQYYFFIYKRIQDLEELFYFVITYLSGILGFFISNWLLSTLIEKNENDRSMHHPAL